MDKYAYNTVAEIRLRIRVTGDADVAGSRSGLGRPVVPLFVQFNLTVQFPPITVLSFYFLLLILL